MRTLAIASLTVAALTLAAVHPAAAARAPRAGRTTRTSSTTSSRLVALTAENARLHTQVRKLQADVRDWKRVNRELWALPQSMAQADIAIHKRNVLAKRQLTLDALRAENNAYLDAAKKAVAPVEGQRASWEVVRAHLAAAGAIYAAWYERHPMPHRTYRDTGDGLENIVEDRDQLVAIAHQLEQDMAYVVARAGQEFDRANELDSTAQAEP